MTNVDYDVGFVHERLCEMQGKEGTVISEDDFRATVEKCSNSRNEFDATRIEEARIKSCSAAIIYHAIRENIKENLALPGFLETKAELESIKRAAKKFLDAVRSASNDTLDILLIGDRIVDSEILSDFKNISVSSFGHPIFRLHNGPGEPGIYFWTTHNIIKMIEVFSNVADQSRNWHQPPTKGGRPDDPAMRMLVTNLRDVWRLVSSDTFTFAAHKGHPTAPSTIFCWEILRLIDPDARFSSLATAMRKEIKQSGTKRGRPPAKTNAKFSKTIS